MTVQVSDAARWYVVCESPPLDNNARSIWTSSIPGVTGPTTLEDDSPMLAAKGWRVYWTRETA